MPKPITRTVSQRCLANELKTISQTALAARLGVSQQLVSSWAKGKLRPAVHYRYALAQLLGINFDNWLTAREWRIASKKYKAL